MTVQIVLVVGFLVVLAALGTVSLWILKNIVSLALSHRDRAPEPGVVEAPDSTLSPVQGWNAYPQPEPWAPARHAEADEWGEEVEGFDDENAPSLLPFSTPLPPLPKYGSRDRSEDEDDVPTTLYRTDHDDGELALIADLDD
ncbi:MAG: hypothetical protein R3F59_32320 [Myxococcota bacterium]